jgi:hypothetical protein
MGYYSDLLANGGPWVTFERCVERAFARVVAEFVAEVDGPLEGVTVYEGHRGLPKIFGGWNTEDGTETFADVAARASHIILLASGREDQEGEEVCELTVIVATSTHDGDPDDQCDKHEQRVAAMRGLLSDGASEESGTDSLMDRLAGVQAAVRITGFERREGPAEMEFTGGRWVATERWIVRGYRTAEANAS